MQSKEVCDAVVLEQLMEVMPQDLRVWLKERKTTAAVEMADNYVAEEEKGAYAVLQQTLTYCKVFPESEFYHCPR